VEIRLLGPVEAAVSETAVPLGPPRQRAVLAMLALAAPDVVSTDRFVDGLWGEDPPAKPMAALQVFVHGLRKALAAADPTVTVERVAPGYRISGVETDVRRFEKLLARAGEAVDDSEGEAALREALSLVRGPALADLRESPFAGPECVRLDELRWLAEEQWYDARLRLGEHAALITDLEVRVRDHPTRERFWGQLMTALYRADRQADALATYARARDVLADELGIDPGQALQQLEIAVLRQDPGLVAPVRPPRPGEPTVPPGPAAPRAAGRVPAPTTPTFGRDELVADVRARLLRPEVRVLTLTGPGGSGKSRVAALVADARESFPAGVAFFPVTERTEGDQLVREIALVLTGTDGGSDPLASLPSDALVVLDNLESMPAAADLVGRLVDGSAVTVLATSRLRLRLRAEHDVPVPPLLVPAGDAGQDAVLAAPAVAMFVDRAAAASGSPDVGREWRDIGRLVSYLDGLPLAIELAASRSGFLSPGQIRDSIQSDLDLLEADAIDVPERQRTLARTIDWSYERLDGSTRSLLDRLALFERSFTVDTARAVFPDVPDLVGSLGRLVEARLVRQVESRVGFRFQVLGTVRAFARQRLDGRSDLPELHDRLADHLHEQARHWRADLDGPEGLVALARYDESAADLDAAIDRLVAAGDAERATALVADVADLWVSSGRLVDGLARTTLLLAGQGSGLPTAHLAAAKLYHQLSRWDRSGEASQQVIDADDVDEADRAWALCLRSNALLMIGELPAGRALAAEALAASEDADCYPVPALALSTLAIGAAMAGEMDAEKEYYERRLAVVAERGDVIRIADTLNVLAEIALDEGDAGTAVALAREATEVAGPALPNETRDATISLARATAALGDVAQSARHLLDALLLVDRTGQDFALGQALRTGGMIAAQAGEWELALRCYAAGHRVAPSPSGTEEPIERDLAEGLERARTGLGERASTVWLVGSSAPAERTRTTLDGWLRERVDSHH
jgi:predicted ATPase/DNA-binding SARP family transcriptional activator